MKSNIRITFCKINSCLYMRIYKKLTANMLSFDAVPKIEHKCKNIHMQRMHIIANHVPAAE